MKIVVSAKSWSHTEAIVHRLLELPHQPSGVLYKQNTSQSVWLDARTRAQSRWLEISIENGQISDTVYTNKNYTRRLTHSVAQVHRLLHDPAFLKRNKLTA